MQCYSKASPAKIVTQTQDQTRHHQAFCIQWHIHSCFGQMHWQTETRRPNSECFVYCCRLRFSAYSGQNTSVKLNLINQIYQISNNIQPTTLINEEFSDCFGEISCLPRVHHIEIIDDVKPVISSVRKIPFALKPKLKTELKRMFNLEIIEPVEKPIDWFNALVIVSKTNGDRRICLDPRPLNKAIKRQHHRLPTAEEIISEMAGVLYFSKLDASSGYRQVKVDDESADLLVFGTPYVRYGFKRLPFGIHSASEVSKQRWPPSLPISSDAPTPRTTLSSGAQRNRNMTLA